MDVLKKREETIGGNFKRASSGLFEALPRVQTLFFRPKIIANYQVKQNQRYQSNKHCCAYNYVENDIVDQSHLIYLTKNCGQLMMKGLPTPTSFDLPRAVHALCPPCARTSHPHFEARPC